MNFLFYVGIIVPTVITISLFIMFIYCWLLQRARKEVVTKKYDPHGKMRSLGMSMNPPLPPTFCLLEDVLLSDVGEDNVAYDVSRSPSTQQDWRGRPLYHTYHDSGISAGLSPSQEHESHQDLAYRTCPDSGLSRHSLLQATPATYHVSRGCCHIDEVLQRQPQLQQVYEDHDTLQQQQYEQQSPHVALHQSQVKASVHLNDGVSCGGFWSDSMTPQNYDCPQTHTTTNHLDEYNLKHSSPHTPTTPTPCTPHASMMSFFHDETGGDNHPQSGHLSFCSQLSQTRDVRSDHEISAVCTEHHIPLDRVIKMSPSVNPHLKQPLTPDSTDHLYDLPLPSSSSSSSTTAIAAIPLKQFYRDSDVMDIGQAGCPSTDRPDSQASQSSTTDSEDSGFRSSYCAAHRKAVLNKQEHPLLKPLRKTRRNKNHSRSSRRTAGSSQNHPGDIHKPYMTLSPKHRERNIHNLSVIQQSMVGVDLFSRPLTASQHRTHMTGSLTSEGNYCTAPAQDQAGSAVCHHFPTNSDHSPVTNSEHSPSRKIWALQSSNDTEVSVKQTIDLTDISRHLGRKCLPEVTASSRPQTHVLDEAGVLEQGRHGGPPGAARQGGADRNLNSYGYSVV